MSFGAQVLEELRRRDLVAQLLYADIQKLKLVPDAAGMRALLAKQGSTPGEDRTDPLHFADLIEIRMLRNSLKSAQAAVLLFGLT